MPGSLTIRNDVWSAVPLLEAGEDRPWTGGTSAGSLGRVAISTPLKSRGCCDDRMNLRPSSPRNEIAYHAHLWPDHRKPRVGRSGMTGDRPARDRCEATLRRVDVVALPVIAGRSAVVPCSATNHERVNSTPRTMLHIAGLPSPLTFAANGVSTQREMMDEYP